MSLRTLSCPYVFLLMTVVADDASRRLQTYAQPSDYASLMLERVNLERRAQRLLPLCLNQKLQKAAQRHSNDQAANNFMDHIGSDNSSASQRITDARYEWRGIAENVAAGQIDVIEVMNAWMNSEGHRLNILGDYTMLGVAYAYTSVGPYNHFWTQNFGLSNTEECDDGSIPSSPPTFQAPGGSVQDSKASGPSVYIMPINPPREYRGRSSSSALTPTLLVQAVAAALTTIVLFDLRNIT